ncbi:MAG TPA: NADH-quinone oxidoreductase subunit L [Candidatus Wallbacteria bacterium]|nr:NADH-quinone oxidoreductase subunit L [Candidatus Wallbacteria bacterium]
MQLINMNLINLIPLFPLIGAIYCFAYRDKKPSLLCGVTASVMIFLSFVSAMSAAFVLSGIAPEAGKECALASHNFTWISAGDLKIGCDLIFDRLTAVMLFVVTFVGLLIHIYSIGYMIHDRDFNRFFSYLNLFVFFMIILVMAKNLILMFVGWEGVGLCSYLLISFWWADQANAAAGRKAFITNRVGDFAFLAGSFILYWLYKSGGFETGFDFIKLAENFNALAAALPSSGLVIIVDLVCVLLFFGACGKSAQIPLYVWLPDAMAGPTPVSALIHAATMVTAGVYMCVRMGFLFAASTTALTIIAATGVLTAVFAAVIAMAQTDIKKVLAYSTVSQLGFMFIAVGCGAFASAIFHLATHAFFKSLLFLAAGSVIHALSGEQNIMKMGGLRGKIPGTFAVFFTGVYAISGLPLMSGFFSKDEILLYSYAGPHSNLIFYALASFASLLTAVYMHRLLFLVFYGEFRGEQKKFDHVHESPAIMMVPLYILAFFSIFSGFAALTRSLNFKNILAWYQSYAAPTAVSHATEYGVMAAALITAFTGVFIAYKIYAVKNGHLEAIDKKFGAVIKIQRNKFYIDELYEKIIIVPLYSTSVILHKYIDVKFIDELVVGGSVNGFRAINAALASAQSGRVGGYLSAMAAGLAVITVYALYGALR